MEMQKSRVSRGFTLVEVMMAIVVIAILLVLISPAIQNVRERVEKARCMANLRNLYTAANIYVQQNGHWPQIDTKLLTADRKAFATAWITALQPMGVTAKDWICPTVQRTSGNPNYLQHDLVRIDYIPMPFDDKQATPYRWPAQPWFAEGGDVHGNGNLIIFTNGSTRELNDVSVSPPQSAQ